MAKQPTTKAKKKTMQQAAPFASYMGIHLEDQRKEDEEQARRAEQEKEWAKKAETDPDREQMEDESDDDYAARMEELDEKEKAEGEINDAGDDETNGVEDEKAKAIRASERARCARIIAEGIKANNVHQAAVFAFDTNLTSSQAISAMAAAKMSAPSGGLGNRMQGVQNHNLGSNSGSSPVTATNKSKAQADSILAALDAARGNGK